MPLKDKKARAAYEKEYAARNRKKIRAQQNAWVKTEKGKKYNCRKSRNERLKKYGLDLKAYDKLLKKCKHRCQICGKHADDCTGSLAVDHCHTTGKVRGLLCNTCNAAIGMLGDNVTGVQRALKYLRKAENEGEPCRTEPDKEVGRLSPSSTRRAVPSVSRQACS